MQSVSQRRGINAAKTNQKDKEGRRRNFGAKDRGLRKIESRVTVSSRASGFQQKQYLLWIDRIISNFGLPMGPFQLQDLAGYGVALAVSKEFASSFPDRTFKSPLVELLVKNGRNGKNNGKGYYTYEKGSKPKPDLSVLPIIEESRRITNMMPGGKPLSVTDQEILEIILFPVVNEACRILYEGVVIRAADLDIASVLGMSFPSYRGGIVFWADLVGPKHIYTTLNKWSGVYGDFFKPSRFLEERAMKGLPLSAPASSSSSRSRM
ncbi:hypothetical protein ACLB2K_005166 [Fragaria x ananassa]